MTRRGLIISAVFCIASMLLMGCASSQPTRFFVLSAVVSSPEGPVQPCRNDTVTTIGINPVVVPRYLDRPQIMTKAGDNEYRLSELNVWAEPLQDNITRVIARNLDSIPCTEIVTIPRTGSQQLRYRLTGEILRLEGAPGGRAVLEARWSITDEGSKKVIVSKTSTYSEQTPSGDHGALVHAYNRMLESFSREISASLSPLINSPAEGEGRIQ